MFFEIEYFELLLTFPDFLDGLKSQSLSLGSNNLDKVVRIWQEWLNNIGTLEGRKELMFQVKIKQYLK